MIWEFFENFNFFKFSEPDEVKDDWEEQSKVWHNDIDWWPLKEGMERAKQLGKPLAVFIKSKDCPSCVKLSENLSQSYFLPEAAKDFVMVLTEYTDIPGDEKFCPDGKYIPRILFFDSDGKLMPNYYNVYGNSTRKYFYWDAWLVIDTMLQITKDKNKWL